MKNQKNENQNFVVTVRSQENHTWQGTVSWVEGKRQEHFRSVLELLKLIDSVVTTDTDDEEVLEVY